MITLGNIYKEDDRDKSNDSKENKSSKIDLLVLIVSLFILLVLVALLILVFRDGVKNVSDDLTNRATSTEVMLLSPEEVETERLFLPSYRAVDMNPSTKTEDQDINQTEGNSNIVAEDQLDNLLKTPVKDLPKTGKTMTVSQPLSPTTKMNSTINVLTEEGSGIEVNNVSISYTDKDRNFSEQERKGILQSINLKDGYLLLVNDAKVVKISLTPETAVYINDKKISISNLLLGDVLEINGSGYNNVSELSAERIKIVAKLQLNSGNN